jgi:hypothetical protein
MDSVPHPEPFLEIRVDRLDPTPALAAACAGYELGEWRCDALARHVLQWLPEFALRFSEWQSMNHADAVAKIARAALSVYESPNFRRRGEFGEILLHILLRQHIGTVPAISKIYFKDARNDTVKGFDAVHVLDRGDELELWLGEVKFYSDIAVAIRHVVAELIDHTQRDYLRSEFAAIVNKIDDVWPQAQQLRKLIAENRSLDQIFANICIPVLLTYDSEAVRNHDVVSDEFRKAFEEEVLRHWDSFQKALTASSRLRVHLFLLPLKEKRALVEKMDEYLKKAQSL